MLHCYSYGSQGVPHQPFHAGNAGNAAATLMALSAGFSALPYLITLPRTKTNTQYPSLILKQIAIHANLDVAFPVTLEKEPYDEHLQPGHTTHHQALHDTKVEDPPLRAPHSTKIPVLSRPEVLLVPRDSGQLARQLVDRFFENRGLLRGGPLLGGQLSASVFVFNL
jgi:hypothetical protein